MKKSYLSRIILSVISITTVFILYIGPCRFDADECFGGAHSLTMIVRMAFAAFIISLFLFAVNDDVFKKWIRFSVLWIIFEMIIIGMTDAHKYKEIGSDGVYPYRGYLSIVLTEIFILLSLFKISWDSFISRKIRQGNDIVQYFEKRKNVLLAVGHAVFLIILAMSYYLAWESVFFMFLSICIVMFILYSVKMIVSRTWFYFSFWFMMLYFFMALTASKSNGSWIFPSDYEFITSIFPVIFFFISVCLIIFGAYKYRDDKSLKTGNIIKKILTP